MTSISPPLPQSLSLLRTISAAAFHHRLPPYLRLPPVSTSATRCFQRLSGPRRSLAVASSATFVPPRSGVYIVGDFMTRKADLHMVKPTPTVDEALDILVEQESLVSLSVMTTGTWLALFLIMTCWHWTPY
ncbi:hypothetical protein CsSME_00006926 [Camellia sinensis var. sinensis]|uniref:CBS domain-containing protein n=1 Tax=Camellia sinensis var. sinensis TaxID=542762 RepID=A0A4V6RYP1_CAMSN|nr:hypothetical protein TEA_012450 [Camellia sinensis var. sinensis]